MDTANVVRAERPPTVELSLLLAKISEAILPSAFLSFVREKREWSAWMARLDAGLFDD